MLTQAYAADFIAQSLLPRSQWHPFPTAAERQAWAVLPASVRQAYQRRGQQALSGDWEVLPATLFLEYARTGNRSHYEGVRDRRRGRLVDLAVAECMEGAGRFLDAIVDGVWLTCEETYWGLPAHLNAQHAGVGLPDVNEPTVDLFAGETVALLAWIHYLLGPQLDTVSPLVSERIRVETRRRVLDPCMARDDFWWMGFAGRRVNNWNPWCNSNWLTAVLLLEDDAARRAAAVVRIMDSLDRFIDPYPADGGCDEGPGYWGRAGASLYDCLELLYSATDGRIDVYAEPLIQDIGRYIYRAQIADRYFVNFADAAALVIPSPGVVFGYGRRIGDTQMEQLGAWAAQQQGIMERGAGDSLGRQLPLLFSLDALAALPPRSPLPRDSWLPEIQAMVARDEQGSSQGFCLAAKGGHNEESHNHNDVGHFVVYRDGRPVIIDVGVETYSAKTFSAQRYEIWTMQSAYHSLPTVDGVMQEAGRERCAREVSWSATDAEACLHLELAAAYPQAAGLDSWRRTLRLIRGEAVEVRDEFSLNRVPAQLTLSLMTPCRVEVEGELLKLHPRTLHEDRRSGAALVRIPAGLTATVEEIALSDRNLRGVWGPRLWRILLHLERPQATGSWALRITASEE